MIRLALSLARPVESTLPYPTTNTSTLLFTIIKAYQKISSLRQTRLSLFWLKIISTTFLQDPKHTATMLRRNPTAITLTTEDIASYEDRRLREEEEERARAETKAKELAAKGAQYGTPKSQNRDPNTELRPLPVERHVRTREERLGLGRN